MLTSLLFRWSAFSPRSPAGSRLDKPSARTREEPDLRWPGLRPSDWGLFDRGPRSPSLSGPGIAGTTRRRDRTDPAAITDEGKHDSSPLTTASRTPLASSQPLGLWQGAKHAARSVVPEADPSTGRACLSTPPTPRRRRSSTGRSWRSCRRGGPLRLQNGPSCRTGCSGLWKMIRRSRSTAPSLPRSRWSFHT